MGIETQALREAIMVLYRGADEPTKRRMFEAMKELHRARNGLQPINRPGPHLKLVESEAPQ